MKGYHFDLSCPTCGAEVVRVADGVPQAGTMAAAVARCTSATCRAQLSIVTTVRTVGKAERRFYRAS